ncbi:MAG: mechanosensitive ion channel family protein [Bacteroidales bacterium]
MRIEDTFKKSIEAGIPWLMDHGIKIFIIVVGAWLLNKIIRKIIIKAVRIAVVPDSNTSVEGEKKREDTLIRILAGATGIFFLLLAILMILQEVGLEIGPILAGAGIVGLAIGFGGQYLIRDIITGLFIILENQYRIGDVIKIDTTGGLVEDISLRKTTLRDLNGTVHHIPHGEVKRVSNLSKKYARVNLDIGISYSSDLEHVIKVINRTGNELAEDPLYKDVIISPPQFLRVEDFADSAIIVKVLGDTRPLRQWEITGEFRKRIKIAFDKEGIEIPFPQRVVHQAKE